LKIRYFRDVGSVPAPLIGRLIVSMENL